VVCEFFGCSRNYHAINGVVLVNFLDITKFKNSIHLAKTEEINGVNKMRVIEKTRPEVEAKLKVMSDFLKMEYLESCLKQNVDFDVKKFCNVKLAELYEGRTMFTEAARNMSAVAEIAATFKEKAQAYMKETELWIKTGQYERAEEAFKKAIASGNIKEREEMKKALNDIYKKQAQAFEKAKRNANALRIYEKLIEISNEQEKPEIKNKLMGLYERLGKIQEFMRMKNSI
jgi:tetratricopeptide (TPR) repeat protein